MALVDVLIGGVFLSLLILGFSCKGVLWAAAAWAGAALFLLAYALLPADAIPFLLAGYALLVGVVVEHGWANGQGR